MDNEMHVPLLNRGRVVWVSLSEVEERLQKGWVRWELDQPPREEYYPQYDRTPTERQTDDRVKRVPGSDDEGKGLLGIVVL